MNELDLKKETLPDTPEDLAKFVLVGREKLKAVKAEISAIEKVGLAKEVHSQKMQEGQEIAEAVLLSEQRLGELLEEIPKATPNNNPFHESDSGVGLVNSWLNSKDGVAK